MRRVRVHPRPKQPERRISDARSEAFIDAMIGYLVR